MRRDPHVGGYLRPHLKHCQPAGSVTTGGRLIFLSSATTGAALRVDSLAI
ncbi:hypothetical protein SAMN04490179_3328 [Pseudomonas antarctica]|uniref:Uncharacterized protein n=1 Tax=Pseudomonas antarctica TaxID=219572 RepID=A0A1G9ZVN3_9PSED|nr:hypothetical protein PSAN_38880 [Pseudomonas antarctica]SDN25147.1 hypothetical protein SAMN04490179_3328 [Pseudomonas antarctica]